MPAGRSVPRPTGYVIYRGPSELDGRPIVAIAITAKSSNRKTGNMVQTYILSDEGLSPIQTVQRGRDGSICGACPHRGDGTGADRTCYVTLAHGPSSVWRTLQAGRYPVAQDIAELGRGRAVRLGTYGDPAAVPVAVWRQLIASAVEWTGYTHQWRTRPDLRDLVMASIDSPREAMTAWALGWRTFRVRTKDQTLAAREITCPASAESGYRTQCADCGLCKGTASPARKSIAIIAHGPVAAQFTGGTK